MGCRWLKILGKLGLMEFLRSMKEDKGLSATMVVTGGGRERLSGAKVISNNGPTKRDNGHILFTLQVPRLIPLYFSFRCQPLLVLVPVAVAAVVQLLRAWHPAAMYVIYLKESLHVQ
ncbi:hypothetical protein CYMTET_18694 [Cymbomonas tetramitiformis]|uniref:Uncharacterized protein n=1 Tax=Cymbomonas tetramitiformis TaxID=36881 RepID=A0AAE0L630_9CHLO|nr:hypothetical protein CYMTET_18694 [Cymbomonas tetramitiformis]